MEIRYTKSFTSAIDDAVKIAKDMQHEYLTPEHVLLGLLNRPVMRELFAPAVYRKLVDDILDYLGSMDKVPEHRDMPELSYQFQALVARSALRAEQTAGNVKLITVPFVVDALLDLKDSWAANLLSDAISGERRQFLERLSAACADDGADQRSNLSVNVVEHRIDEASVSDKPESQQEEFVVVEDVTGMALDLPPLIGRKAELDKVVETICRLDNNNVMLVGEPGVGRHAIVNGLAVMMHNGDVPKRLKKMNVYYLDVARLSSGVQFRGEFEHRLNSVVGSIVKRSGESFVMLIDSISAFASQGQNNESSVDVAGVMKAYLEDTQIPVICIATFDEVSKAGVKNKNMLQMFRRIDVNEPSVDEAIEILEGLKQRYEVFHGVEYTREALKCAVEMSQRYVRERCLPEKAIDIIDQAGARKESTRRRKKGIGHDEIAETIRSLYNIKAVGDKDETTQLLTLGSRMKSKIYGQDEAIDSIVNAIHLWKSGLSDQDKPIASLLFVGPTGVGKTEVARTLADEMGVPLQRFDMSEYVEKHTVAKLIGSPAGYIGYEDGGLLTEAIRKTPNCVLLFDEIEKAHSDIYNILLQVMDYGALTDSRGQKATFQNVVIIMTSNAGAQYAHMASLGFASRNTSGDSMMSEVKKVFKPEFINRLTGSVVFNGMDDHMANLILDKKIGDFARRLTDKHIRMNVVPEAREWMLRKGITKEYGAREIDRVVSNVLKPLFVNEILFGKLKNGGDVDVVVCDGELKLEVPKTEEPVGIEAAVVPAPRRRKSARQNSGSANAE